MQSRDEALVLVASDEEGNDLASLPDETEKWLPWCLCVSICAAVEVSVVALPIQFWAPYSLPPLRGESLGSFAGLDMYVGGLTYGIPYKGDKRIQSSHRLGAAQYTTLVMLAARDRTMIVPRTIIFAVAHLGFVAWSIPFGFELCAAPIESSMLVLISPAPMPSGEREGRRQRYRKSVSGSHSEYSNRKFSKGEHRDLLRRGDSRGNVPAGSAGEENTCEKAH